MDPLITTSLITGGSSLLGGLFGMSSQNKTNKINLQIARETNQANRENQEYQNEWNYNMWNKQNEYNTPLNQRKRLDDAGLNPIFYGLDGTGNAGALQSAPFTAVNGAPMENSGVFMQQGLMNAANTFADAKLKLAQAKNIEEQTNNVKEDTKSKQIANRIAEAQEPAIIETAFVRLKIDKGVLDMQPDQKKLLGKNVEELDASIQHMRDDTALRKRMLKLQEDQFKWQKIFDEMKLNFEQEKFIKQLALGWFNACTSRKAVDLQQALTDSQVHYLNSLSDVQQQELYEKIYSFGVRMDYIENMPNYQQAQIKFVDGQLKLFDKQGNLLDQQTESARFDNTTFSRGWRIYSDVIMQTNGAVSAIGSVVPF